ncbi:TPA: hypothetical protein EYP70_05015 [Candidatus Bathyarchaeota archaeon]|nr:hypothetical protein [Candidatus Bathyarchaeota archaeon]
MEDRDMWIRFAEKGLVLGIVPEPLYIYFIRPNSLTRRHKKKVLECGLRLIEKWKEKAFIMDQSLKKGYAEELWNLARKALYDTKDYKLMFRCALKSQIYNPSLKRIMKSFPSALLHTLRSLRDFD